MKAFKKLALGVLAVGLLGSMLVGCGSTENTNTETSAALNTGGEEVTIKIGVNGTEFAVWNYVKDELAKENIELEIMSFTDYVQPNLALDQGEIDINSFQTEVYFNQFREDHNLDIVPFGYTIVAPMGIYADTLTEVTSIEEGGQVAIPNDATNGGRALLLLEEVGLITIGEYDGVVPEVKDIVNNPKNLEIISMAAHQIPLSLPDIDLGVINSGVATTAGITPEEEALYIESVESENIKKYYNIFAIRTEDTEREELIRLVEIYQTDAVKEIILEVYKGAQTPIF